MSDRRSILAALFPENRFEPTFPLPVWFAGLWLYLKSFLYICYVYMFGIEPPPYSSGTWFEIAYFSITFIPAFLLAYGLWQLKEKYIVPSILFFLVDTPVLAFHVLRLAQAGYMDSGLTKILELGSLVLNVVALGWLIGFRSAQKNKKLNSGMTI